MKAFRGALLKAKEVFN